VTEGNPPKATVFDIERFAVHDGPGIRTTVFLKGCFLQCRWCHNPESMSAQPTLLFTVEHCVGCGECAKACPEGVHTLVDGRHDLLRGRCVTCGACVQACFTGALEMAGREMTVDEVMREVLLDAPFYSRSGGGMTVSGGEPLAQFPFTHALLQAAKAHDLHTALDTSGLCSWDHLQELIPNVDLFLYDLKHMDPARHQALTGASNEPILSNLRRLDQTGKTIWIRIPLIPGQNDEETNFHSLGRFIAPLESVERVEILRYHRLAETKYERMGNDYPLKQLDAPSAAVAESRRQILAEYRLPHVIWR
jgi:pyruvate formate lyase activating enzyme